MELVSWELTPKMKLGGDFERFNAQPRGLYALVRVLSEVLPRSKCLRLSFWHFLNPIPIRLEAIAT